MLTSVEYIHGVFTIMDNELGAITADEGGLGWWVAIVATYSKLKLPVGKNLARAAIFYGKKYEHDIKRIVLWQDDQINAHAIRYKKYDKERSKYLQYFKERDEHLEKLLVLL